jgi:hypothetical protein
MPSDLERRVLQHEPGQSFLHDSAELGQRQRRLLRSEVVNGKGLRAI